MKFILIDKVIALDRGSRLRAIKSVSLAEEYLADHFPAFPVLPGVLLLQGLIESASWLVREGEDFAHSMVLLNRARNVKYKSFAAPGTQIEYHVEALDIEDTVSRFKAAGYCRDEALVEARIELRHFNLADRDPTWAAMDQEVIRSLRDRWKLLYAPGQTEPVQQARTADERK